MGVVIGARVKCPRGPPLIEVTGMLLPIASAFVLAQSRAKGHSFF
jgi:hypothetical protein